MAALTETPQYRIIMVRALANAEDMLMAAQEAADELEADKEKFGREAAQIRRAMKHMEEADSILWTVFTDLGGDEDEFDAFV